MTELIYHQLSKPDSMFRHLPSKIHQKWYQRTLYKSCNTSGVSRYNVCKTINSKYYIGQFMRLKKEIGEKRLQMKKKKVLFHQDNAPCHKSLATVAKLHELGFELLPHPPYSPDLAPSDYYLFADLKKMLQRKRFYSNEEVIAETNAYFEANNKSFYKKGIQMLEKRWTDCMLLKETILMSKVEFSQKNVFSLVSPGTY
ncbi:hypothetical protein K1T71_014978 [Dendrolimus kikuchii]|nr:hypothetical protein K1T71_014978 [Dendrolimus kikuchii]